MSGMSVIKHHLKSESTTGKGCKGGKGGWSHGGNGGDVAEMFLNFMGMVTGKGGGGSWGQKKFTFTVDKSGGEMGEFTGKIKRFFSNFNYGFIDSPEVTAAGHGDVFLHGDMKKGYREGQIVKFDCVLNKEGKPVAINLRSGLKDSAQPQMVSQPQMVNQGWQQAWQQAWQQCGQPGWHQNKFEIDRSGGELGEFTGTIRRFGMQHNYGFIDCPEVKTAGYGDVFLHGNMKKGYREGQTVKFDCVLNKEGKPVAINLRSGLKDATPPQIMEQGSHQDKFEIDKSGGELGEFTGTIKRFVTQHNYGFIECPEVTAAGMGDVFLHGNMKKGYREGQTVKFDCVLNKEAKPLAINLRSGLK